MKFWTAITLIIVTLLICVTVLLRDFLRYDVAFEMRSLELQFIGQHLPQPTEPEQPGLWQPNTFRMRPRDNTAAALSPAPATSRGPQPGSSWP